MAGQFAVIHSGLLTGAAIIAGGPYYSAGDPGRPPFTPYLSNAMSGCLNPQESGARLPEAQAHGGSFHAVPLPLYSSRQSG